MTESMFRVDGTSVVLLVALLILLLYARVSRQYNEPLLHPLILQRQSDASTVHLPNESATYRHVNAPLGLDLAMRPHRSTPTVATMLARGVEDGTANVSRRVLDASLSNTEIRIQAATFLNGVKSILKTEMPTIVVCGFMNSSRALTALLAPSLMGCDAKAIMIPPGTPPTTLPQSVDLASTAVVCIDAPLLSCFEGAGLIVANENSDLKGHDAMTWDDVLGHAANATVPLVPDESRTASAELDRIGARTFATFWDAASGAWVSTTETSMTSGVTTWLSQFPVESIPRHGDVMLTDLMYARAIPAPVFVTLVLTALYTGASIAMEPSTQLVPLSKVLRPTLLYLSTYGAQCIEQSLWMPSVSTLMYPLMRRMNMDLLRNGVLPKNRFLDRLVCRPARRSVSLDNVRAALVAGDGTAAEQSLIDSLRLHLGVPVMHSYVPHTLSCDAKPSIVTAPVCTSNLYDLQAFAPQLVRDDSARCLPAHVGPPSVSVELKLVDKTSVTQAHAAVIERLRAEGNDDPIGELYVRGYTVSQTGHDDTRISPWHSTGDLALVRTNGTFVLIAPRSAEEAGVMPNTITSTEASRMFMEGLQGQGSRRRVSAHGLATVPTLLAMLMLVASPVLAHGSLHHYPHQHMQLQRRADDSQQHRMNMSAIDLALTGIMSMQRASWEQGVLQSAVTEFFYPEWGMFASERKQFPQPKSVPPNAQPIGLLRLAQSSVDGQDPIGRLASQITGDEAADRGASMDSASCGEGVLVSAWIKEGFPNNEPDPKGYFGPAARKQLEFLLRNVSRTPNGAISQRVSPKQIELWSDSAYMGPPFLAMYGFVSHNRTLVQMAFNQLSLQRRTLARTQGDSQHLWRHIVAFPNGRNKTQNIDGRVWLTGNGWAAAGMLRVAATISHSPWADEMRSQYTQLLNWTDEILNAAYLFVDQGTGFMHNAIDDTKSFLDGSGSALMAYAAFRLGSMDKEKRAHIDMAEQAYKTLSGSLNSFSQFTNGIQTVNEMRSDEAGPTSTESLAFFILLTAARRDYYFGNVTGTGDAVDPPPSSASDMLTYAHSMALWNVALAMLVAYALM